MGKKEQCECSDVESREEKSGDTEKEIPNLEVEVC